MNVIPDKPTQFEQVKENEHVQNSFSLKNNDIFLLANQPAGRVLKTDPLVESALEFKKGIRELSASGAIEKCPQRCGKKN